MLLNELMRRSLRDNFLSIPPLTHSLERPQEDAQNNYCILYKLHEQKRQTFIKQPCIKCKFDLKLK